MMAKRYGFSFHTWAPRKGYINVAGYISRDPLSANPWSRHGVNYSWLALDLWENTGIKVHNMFIGPFWIRVAYLKGQNKKPDQ